MKIEPSKIHEVVLFSPQIFKDTRGFFMETWNRREFAKLGFTHDFVQDNFTSSKKDTLRGIHYQLQNPQGKLIRVAKGEIFDVAVDLRRTSATFGQWAGFRLCAEDHQLLWIPPGFGHGFLALKDDSEVIYKCTDYYNPAAERCIVWNDPDLAVAWPVPTDFQPILSEKDKNGSRFRDAQFFLSPVGNSL